MAERLTSYPSDPGENGVRNSHAMPLTLSVVLPNYNHAKFIGRALAALLGQERAADEIIVIDDGSTDDSVAVIERIAATAPAIRLLRNPGNVGVIPTLQRGLEAARGKYVYFAASDDWIFPGFFALALRRLEADPDMGLFCGEAMLIDGASNRPFAVRPAVRPRLRAGRIEAAAAQQLLRSTDNWILTGSAIFRRDCVTWAGGFDARLGSFADGFIARKVALKYRLPVRAGNRRQLGGVPRQRLAQDGARPATHEIHSRRRSDPDRRRSRLPVLVRERVPRPLAVCRVPPGAPGRPDRAVGPPRTGCAFRCREGQIGVDFGVAAAELGALGDSGPAMVSAAADVALGAVADDAGDARPASRFALSVRANTRYDGGDCRPRRRLTRSFTF